MFELCRAGGTGAGAMEEDEEVTANACLDAGNGIALCSGFTFPRKSNIPSRHWPICLPETNQHSLKNLTDSLFVCSLTERREVCSLGTSSASILKVWPDGRLSFMVPLQAFQWANPGPKRASPTRPKPNPAQETKARVSPIGPVGRPI